jgi:hypothetical protein
MNPTKSLDRGVVKCAFSPRLLGSAILNALNTKLEILYLDQSVEPGDSEEYDMGGIFDDDDDNDHHDPLKPFRHRLTITRDPFTTYSSKTRTRTEEVMGMLEFFVVKEGFAADQFLRRVLNLGHSTAAFGAALRFLLDHGAAVPSNLRELLSINTSSGQRQEQPPKAAAEEEEEEEDICLETLF